GRPPSTSGARAPQEPRAAGRPREGARNRPRREVERASVDPDRREHGRERRGDGQLPQIPGHERQSPTDARGPRGDQHHDDQAEQVHDSAHRHAAGVQADSVDAVDAPLEVEHPAIGADLRHLPSSEATVSRSRLTPLGVASRTATIPTARTPAASLKSRLNASTVAATARARPIRLIATARPMLPARAAADSSEPLPASGAADRVTAAPSCDLTAAPAYAGTPSKHRAANAA